MRENEKFAYQDSMYGFPYHYLPSLDDSIIRLHRQLSWGLDYITYMSFIAESVHKLNPESLCDVGCGDGRLIHMVKAFVPHITGIDPSERSIAFARAFNPEVEILCGNIADLSHRYEMVTLVEVLEHVPDEQMGEFICILEQLITPAGYLLGTVPTANIPLNIKHYRHYNLRMLKKSLTPYFQLESHWWLYRRSHLERFLRRLICNQLFLLNFPPHAKTDLEDSQTFRLPC